MEVGEAIRGRRSIGRLAGAVSRQAIAELIGGAVRAPNHHLTEPWRFTVVQGEGRRRLGEFWGKRAAEVAGLSGEAAEKYAEGESGKTLRAPVLIVVSVRTDPDPVVASEDQSAAAAAIQNILLAAHGCGLGAIWRTGKMVYDDAIKRFLGLDPSDRILGVVYLGQPAAEPKEKPEPKRHDVIAWFE